MNSGILVELKTENGIQNLSVKRGTILRDLAAFLTMRMGMRPPVFATINGEVQDMNFELRHSSVVEFFDMTSRVTRLMYQRTVYFLFQKALDELVPGTRTTLRYPLNDGLFVELDRDISVAGMVTWNIEKKMRQYIAEGQPLRKELISRNVILSPNCPPAIDSRMRNLVKNSEIQEVYLYSLGNFSRALLDPLMPSVSAIDLFEMIPYDGNMILRVPHFRTPDEMREYKADKNLYKVFQDFERWRGITEVDCIDDLNRKIDEGKWRDLILISEAQHERNIVAIADQICKTGRRIILIAGPSASGKTTFAQRLCIQLRVNGLRPLYMGTDDYFREQVDLVPDENGKLNFEDLTAVDVELFNQHMNELLEGKTVDIPVFDFISGSKRYGMRITQAEANQPIVIEGIHALNPELTRAIAENEKFKIYICPLTSLNVNEDNRMAVTDIRLIRRMARDIRSRNRTAEQTLEQWHSVRVGEEKNIFPFKGEADVMFNSMLVYELAALRPLVEEPLKKVPQGDEKYIEAQRILRILRCVRPLTDYKDISTNSIIREFTGGGIWVK